jgi:hypothetical protein
MRALSVRVRNWWARSVCTSEIRWCLVPPKIKVTSLYFNPKVTNPEWFYGVKITEIWAIENLTLGHLYTKKAPWVVGISDFDQIL